ncbi:DoxX family protein [Salinimicrobium sediminilitoris]|uniref:DoxX family protein n=1 Tax=Salinimicrobium sediminilitoris TaxID=2876715 RepID=UPI001E4661FB|nr:DoxX family protein [Salinimicrobium sediminilitoris]MCC8358645.1 DoxX family protein [Salinimicrobium sediminilitoris]
MKNTYTTNLELAKIDLGLLFLRLGAAGLMLTHGYPKLLNLFGSEEIVFADPAGLGMATTLALAVFAEFICSILVILGLGTRLAVIPLIITMFTAAFVIHAADPFQRKELALIYLLNFTVLLITGAGKHSLDFHWLKRK